MIRGGTPRMEELHEVEQWNGLEWKKSFRMEWSEFNLIQVIAADSVCTSPLILSIIPLVGPAGNSRSKGPKSNFLDKAGQTTY